MVMEAGLACAKANHRLHLHLHLSKKATLVALLLLLSYGVGSVHCSTVCRSWEARTPVCWWAGVRCGRKKRPGRVVELDLEYLFLSRTISPSLGNLMFLEELDLSLRGILRKGYQNFLLQRIGSSGLRRWTLSSNNFNGQVPSHFGMLSNLSKLDLGDYNPEASNDES
uniref:Leucine-rich repeat-containing N-terminal plant-type domain-containing protein n=1 Tax=Oryza meridionalis TaxID=40149 RepID=A0A0E0CN94_9ORYZ